jgi:hypothetical protein
MTQIPSRALSFVDSMLCLTRLASCISSVRFCRILTPPSARLMSSSTPYSLRDIRAHALAGTAPSPSRDIASTITLTPDESKICTLLDDFTKELRSSGDEYTGVECRIAGGWVRDKVSSVMPFFYNRYLTQATSC